MRVGGSWWSWALLLLLVSRRFRCGRGTRPTGQGRCAGQAAGRRRLDLWPGDRADRPPGTQTSATAARRKPWPMRRRRPRPSSKSARSPRHSPASCWHSVVEDDASRSTIRCKNCSARRCSCPSAERPITLVDLATHSSGLPRMPLNFLPKRHRQSVRGLQGRPMGQIPRAAQAAASARRKVRIQQPGGGTARTCPARNSGVRLRTTARAEDLPAARHPRHRDRARRFATSPPGLGSR